MPDIASGGAHGDPREPLSSGAMSTATGRPRTGQRSLIGLLIALLTVAVVWWTQGDGNTPGAAPESAQETSSQTSSSARSTVPTDGDTDPDSGLPIIRIADLPPEAVETLRLIDEGGPFPYDRDGVTFENREDLLPEQGRGYYREYTVETPGSDDRGARRIVTGSGAEFFWTDDHYSSFSRIAR